MLNFLSVFNEVLILILIIATGFIVARINILDDRTIKQLSELLVKVTAPMLIINSFIGSITLEVLINAFKVFLFALLIHFAAILVSSILLSKKKHEARTKIIKLAVTFSNCGFMGIPVLKALYGNEGVIYASLYMLVYNVLVWTYGIKVMTKEEGHNLKKVLFNPGLFAILTGVILVLTKINVPYPISRTIDLIGHMTTPISMIIVGALISKNNVKNLFLSKFVYYLSFLRLILVPLLAMIVFRVLNFDGTYIKALVMLTAMPVGTIVAIFAEKYEFEAVTTSKTVGFSTLFSIVTIPIFAMIVNAIF